MTEMKKNLPVERQKLTPLLHVVISLQSVASTHLSEGLTIINIFHQHNFV